MRVLHVLSLLPSLLVLCQAAPAASSAGAVLLRRAFTTPEQWEEALRVAKETKHPGDPSDKKEPGEKIYSVAKLEEMAIEKARQLE